jgi:sugar phosphate isomerase/epimerase
MSHEISRRELLSVAGVTLAAGAAAGAAPETDKSNPAPFRYALNTSTIRGQNLSIEDEIDVAAKAGYGGVEIWMRKLHEYAQQGKKLSELRKRIEGHGLKVPSAIGFAKWIVDDEATRTQGLEEARRDMDLLAQIGAERIAAPPIGATRGDALDLAAAARRYRALLELGDAMGVVPQVEVWGFSKNLSRLGESVFVMIESGHPKACLLPDVYHVYKGGSEFSGLTLLSGSAIQVFHMNDYPADPPRETIGDANRVYPGDGVAPLSAILRGLRTSGFAGWLSLELFNRDYWKQNALDVARTGLAKMKEAVGKAISG